LYDGLHQLFEQPEFSSVEILRDFAEILEERGYLREIVEQTYSGPGVQVAIGGELRNAGMRHFSLVLAEYGVVGHIRGVAGLLGPKRMDYGKNISAVRYLAELMSQMTEEVYR
ncbi:MAG: HrcA family transcriptional regulator, partial [Dehalococcoidia bacterium]